MLHPHFITMRLTSPESSSLFRRLEFKVMTDVGHNLPLGHFISRFHLTM